MVHLSILQCCAAFFCLISQTLGARNRDLQDTGGGLPKVQANAIESGYSSDSRIIISYPVGGCKTSESSSHVIASPIETREYVIKELQQRVAKAIEQKENEDGQAIHTEEGDLGPVIRTSYLSSLEMEIADVPDGLSSDDLIKLLEGINCIQSVSKDYIKIIPDPLSSSNAFDGSDDTSRDIERRHIGFKRVSEATSDPYFSKQWHLHSSNIHSVNAEGAWQSWKGSEDMVIAVIDNGCDINHEDLKDSLWTNPGEICGDGIDNDNNGYIDDCHGWDFVDNDNDPSPSSGSSHGTAVAGVIAASPDNTVGVAGICWSCKVVCLKFIDNSKGSISNQVKAIDYVAKMGIKISSNSYGGYSYNENEKDAIERMKSFGHLFVSSAGNNQLDTDLQQNFHSPSMYDLDNILGIGAIDKDGSKAKYSNYGLTSVDLFAPGTAIHTTSVGNKYITVSGTSFAAPMGSATAGLIWSKYPNMTYTDIVNIFIDGCQKTPRLKDLSRCPGHINIKLMMEKADEIMNQKVSNV